MRKEQRAQGIPPHWMSYVAVESADETAKKARELGGTVLMDPFDVFDLGRMSVIQDPTGAIFSAWQSKKHFGAGVLNETGALCWTELMTSDMDKARTFYTSLLPWKAETMNMPEPYTILNKSDGQAGGMMQMSLQTAQKGIPSHWGIYFQVDDCDATVKKAGTLGATIDVPPRDIPGIGRFSALRDPQGASFAVIAMSKKS
jgi:predicted enzyme related to lactoylglutathione lyase